jgi:hypothetical protein
MPLGTLFKRPYTKVHDIEHLSVDQILQIPRNQISTTSIIEDDKFNTLSELQQDAVKYMASRKRLENNGILKYENILTSFAHNKKTDRAVNDLVNITSVQNEQLQLDEIERRLRALHDGGKKRSRKQRKQRRRKTRRSV